MNLKCWNKVIHPSTLYVMFFYYWSFLVMPTNPASSGLQLAEKYFVKGGDPRAAIEMYTKANMYEAAHKVTTTGLQLSIFAVHFFPPSFCKWKVKLTSRVFFFTACSSVHDTRGSCCNLYIAGSRAGGARQIQRGRKVISLWLYALRQAFLPPLFRLKRRENTWLAINHVSREGKGLGTRLTRDGHEDDMLSQGSLVGIVHRNLKKWKSSLLYLFLSYWSQ